MKFWDSSAIVPLLVEEAESPLFARIYAADHDLVVWWATEVECASALARRARGQSGEMTGALDRAYAQLDQFVQRWHEVAPAHEVRQVARRLLRTHLLRAADALQLAAALVARGEQPVPFEFVCADDRLIAVARGEGLTIAALDEVREPDESSYQAIREKRRRRAGKGKTR